MTKFNGNKTQVITMLIGLIGSIVVGIGGLFFVFLADDDDLKKAEWFLILSGVGLFISTVSLYSNMTIEVIVSDDYICINKPGRTEMKSQIVNFSDIISVSCAKKLTPITKQLVTSVSIVTKTGTKLINNIEKPDELTKIINEKIDTEEQ